MRTIWFFLMIALAFVLTACLPSVGSDLDARVVQAVAATMAAEHQFSTAVEQTVAAQIPLASPTAATEEATAPEILLPSPTFTQLVLDTPTLLPINPTATRIPVQPAQYSCTAILRKPADNTEFRAGAHFDIKWTIVNTGTKAWVAGIDVKYYSGPKISTSTRTEISKVMNPGDTYEINLDGIAPDEKGRQVMTWVVDGPICYPYVSITVK